MKTYRRAGFFRGPQGLPDSELPPATKFKTPRKPRRRVSKHQHPKYAVMCVCRRLRTFRTVVKGLTYKCRKCGHVKEEKVG